MTTYPIHWNLLTRTKNAEKAKRVISDFAERIGHDVRIMESKPYWKIEGTFETRAVSSLEADSIEVAVYTILRDLTFVRGNTRVIGPLEFESAVEFEVILSEPSVNGLEWVHMQLGPFPGDAP